MKKCLVILIALMVVGIVGAQAPTGSSISFNSGTGPCPAPAAGVTTLCSNGLTPAMQSVNGAAYASLQGATGAAGSPGATGPAGPPGTNWSVCTGATLTPTGVVGGIVQYTLSIIPANCK